MENVVVETKNLTKVYNAQKSVDNLNLHVQQGHIYGLLGRNGAGKTTTMKMLLNLITPTEGTALIFGQDIHKEYRSILPRVGSLIEDPGFYPNLTATENLSIFAEMRKLPSKKIVPEALEFVGLPYKDKKLFSQFSLGMKQRLAIALSVMHDPELLILDEPINGLDPIGIVEMREFIKKLCVERNKTIIISSHILSEISLIANDIGIIHEGKLLVETPLEKLNEKNRRYLHFTVSDAKKAGEVLVKTFQTRNFEIDEKNSLILFDLEIPIEKIVKSFINNEIDVKESQVHEESLEEYFKKLTGGVGIA